MGLKKVFWSLQNQTRLKIYGCDSDKAAMHSEKLWLVWKWGVVKAVAFGNSLNPLSVLAPCGSNWSENASIYENIESKYFSQNCSCKKSKEISKCNSEVQIIVAVQLMLNGVWHKLIWTTPTSHLTSKSCFCQAQFCPFCNIN